MPLRHHQAALVILPDSRINPGLQRLRVFADKLFVRWPSHVKLLPHTLIWKDEAWVDEAVERTQIAVASSGCGPFKAKLHGFHHFQHSPSNFTMWMGVQAPELFTLQQHLALVFSDLEEEFIPHLCVGQANSWHELETAKQTMSEAWQPTTFRVSEVAILTRSSFLDPFALRATVPLGGRTRRKTPHTTTAGKGKQRDASPGDGEGVHLGGATAPAPAAAHGGQVHQHQPYVATVGRLDDLLIPGSGGGGGGGGGRLGGGVPTGSGRSGAGAGMSAGSSRTGGGATGATAAGRRGVGSSGGSSAGVSQQASRVVGGGAAGAHGSADGGSRKAAVASVVVDVETALRGVRGDKRSIHAARAAWSHQPAAVHPGGLQPVGTATPQGGLQSSGTQLGSTQLGAEAATGSPGAAAGGDKAVWYFAYSADVSPRKLRARGIVPLASRPACLPGYTLVFNHRGGVGNLMPAHEARMTGGRVPVFQQQGDVAVHGVLHLLRPEDMARVTLGTWEHWPCEVEVQPYDPPPPPAYDSPPPPSITTTSDHSNLHHAAAPRDSQLHVLHHGMADSGSLMHNPQHDMAGSDDLMHAPGGGGGSPAHAPQAAHPQQGGMASHVRASMLSLFRDGPLRMLLGPDGSGVPPGEEQEDVPLDESLGDGVAGGLYLSEEDTQHGAALGVEMSTRGVPLMGSGRGDGDGGAGEHMSRHDLMIGPGQFGPAADGGVGGGGGAGRAPQQEGRGTSPASVRRRGGNSGSGATRRLSQLQAFDSHHDLLASGGSNAPAQGAAFVAPASHAGRGSIPPSDGQEATGVLAVVYVSPPERQIALGLPPTHRYLQMLTEGALEAGLRTEWVEWLARVPSVDAEARQPLQYMASPSGQLLAAWPRTMRTGSETVVGSKGGAGGDGRGAGGGKGQGGVRKRRAAPAAAAGEVGGVRAGGRVRQQEEEKGRSSEPLPTW